MRSGLVRPMKIWLGLADGGEFGERSGGIAVEGFQLDRHAEVARLGDQWLEQVGVGLLDLVLLLAEGDLGAAGAGRRLGTRR